MHYFISFNRFYPFSKICLIWLSLFIVIIGITESCSIKRSRYTRRVGVYHIVEQGQTLWMIAKAYKKDIRSIIKANHLRGTKDIRVGQRLFIPGAEQAIKVKGYESLPLPQQQEQQKEQQKEKEKESDIPKDEKIFIWPVKGILTSKFGLRNNRHHDGIDISAREGTYILAAESGKISFSDYGPKGYGKIVIIRHNNRFTTIYAHNSKNLVKKGQIVKKGQRIAKVGSTGRATAPHLHFEIRVDKMPVNPLKYLLIN